MLRQSDTFCFEFLCTFLSTFFGYGKKDKCLKKKIETVRYMVMHSNKYNVFGYGLRLVFISITWFLDLFFLSRSLLFTYAKLK